MSYAGLRVLALESRRAMEIAKLIENNGGIAVVAPALREVPVEDNTEAFAFAERLEAGDFDMMIFLTGVGARALDHVLATRFGEGFLQAELKKLTVVARGPKPMAVLREWGVPVHVAVPEPNTWRELLVAIAGRTERRIAVQEYGKPNLELYKVLEQRGASVSAVRVYQWALPEDVEPLRSAIRAVIAGEIDVMVLTTGVQATHLIEVAQRDGLADALRTAFDRVVVASIGPTASDTLEELGIKPDMIPSHPKMGFLIKEAGEQAQQILNRKRPQL